MIIVTIAAIGVSRKGRPHQPGERIEAMSSQPMTPEQEWKYAQCAMSWYGWGSPIGLSIFVASLTLAALAIRFIVTG